MQWLHQCKILHVSLEVSIILIVIIILIAIDLPDDVVFVPQRAGAGCFLLLPFFPTCVAELKATPTTSSNDIQQRFLAQGHNV